MEHTHRTQNSVGKRAAIAALASCAIALASALPASADETAHSSGESAKDSTSEASANAGATPEVDGPVVSIDPVESADGGDYGITNQASASGERMLINIAELTAPTAYSFNVTGADLIISLPDGSLALLDVAADDQVSLVGTIAAPWAHDATGAPVPTHFEVSGTTVTQVVEHRSGQYVYAITADPDLSKCAAGALAGLLPGAGAAAAAGSVIPFWGTLAGGVVGALYGAGTGCILAGG